MWIYTIYIINMDLHFAQHFATCPLNVLTCVLCVVTVCTSIQKKLRQKANIILSDYKSISNTESLNGYQHQLLVDND